MGKEIQYSSVWFQVGPGIEIPGWGALRADRPAGGWERRSNIQVFGFRFGPALKYRAMGRFAPTALRADGKGVSIFKFLVSGCGPALKYRARGRFAPTALRADGKRDSSIQVFGFRLPGPALKYRARGRFAPTALRADGKRDSIFKFLVSGCWPGIEIPGWGALRADRPAGGWKRNRLRRDIWLSSDRVVLGVTQVPGDRLSRYIGMRSQGADEMESPSARYLVVFRQAGATRGQAVPIDRDALPGDGFAVAVIIVGCGHGFRIICALTILADMIQY